MSSQEVSLDYLNSVVYDLQKAFWDERGKGARFRTTTIGKQYFTDKVLPLLKSDEVEHILQTIDEVLQSEGIAAKVSYDAEERLLRVQVKGCIHRQVEERMLEKDIERNEAQTLELGNPEAPLLLAVRGGSVFSMPS